jgi:hypothetical protein
MATPFDRLMTTIRPHLPGAIDEAIRQELFMMCTEFFKISDTWREDIDVTLQPNKTEVDIMPFAGRIERLLYVTQDGRGVKGVTMPDLQTLRFPFPSETGGNYVATVSLTVSDPITRDAYPIVPYEIVQRYNEEMMHGILARMMAQPSKPYTNLQMASFYMRKFKGGASRAKNAANTGNTKNSQAWSYPQTFNHT